MTLQRFLELCQGVPFGYDKFGRQNRLLNYIARELIEVYGFEAIAPEVLWDDDGMLVLADHAADVVRVVHGIREEGWWLRRPLRSLESISGEREPEVGASAGIPEVVAGGALEEQIVHRQLVVERTEHVLRVHADRDPVRAVVELD